MEKGRGVVRLAKSLVSCVKGMFGFSYPYPGSDLSRVAIPG